MTVLDIFTKISSLSYANPAFSALRLVGLLTRIIIGGFARQCRANYRVSCIGLVHSCLDSTGESLDASFGPVRMWSFAKSAKGPVNAPRFSLIAGIARFAGMVIRARIDGSYKRTPLFVASTGVPIVTPQVLSPSERHRLRNAV
jgi:hypothetical protein